MSKWGTSQATPFVVGVAALFLQQNPNSKPDEVLAALQNAAKKGAVTDPKGSQNFVLQSVSIPLAGSEASQAQFVKLFPCKLSLL
jgi:subtilisin family serine protease